jgi:hypothetical protein
MSVPKPCRHRRSWRRRHAQIHLPSLRGDQALHLVALFERAIAAIWRAHGDDMADELGRLGVHTPMPPDAVIPGNPNADESIDF